MYSEKRLCLLDSIRGFSVLSMVIYHAMYDIVAIYKTTVDWYFDTPGYIWQQSICWTFILISGACWGMSKNPLKRGLMISGCGLIITAATWLFMPSQLIIMGILSFLGLAAIVMIPVSKISKGHPARGAMVSFLLFLLFRNINKGFLGFEKLNLAEIPQILYHIPGGFILGLPSPDFWSGDYFSLLPWFFLFSAGYFMWQAIREKAVGIPLFYKDIPFLGAIGRKSLIIYMLHQPVTMVVLELCYSWLK